MEQENNKFSNSLFSLVMGPSSVVAFTATAHTPAEAQVAPPIVHQIPKFHEHSMRHAMGALSGFHLSHSHFERQGGCYRKLLK